MTSKRKVKANQQPQCDGCFGAGTVAGGFSCPLCKLNELRRAREKGQRDAGRED